MNQDGFTVPVQIDRELLSNGVTLSDAEVDALSDAEVDALSAASEKVTS